MNGCNLQRMHMQTIQDAGFYNRNSPNHSIRNTFATVKDSTEHVEDESKDEVDYALIAKKQTINFQHETVKNNNNNIKSNNNNNLPASPPIIKFNNSTFVNNKKLINGRCSGTSLYGDCEVKTTIKSSFATLEKLPIFKMQGRKKSDTNLLAIKEKPKFVKSASIARLLGNTYNTKKYHQQQDAAEGSPQSKIKNIERFTQKRSTSTHQTDVNLCDPNSRQRGIVGGVVSGPADDIQLKDFICDDDRSLKAFRSISRTLGKLLRRRTHSVDISQPDPEYKVSYLGNVLTGWAKGEGCVEKPLNTLWRNYTQNHKPDVIMRVRVCASGLKATTRQHGLTEYWAHRITHCCAPKNYPRVFCWIYRHEGRKLKHEMRCHAVLCSKESIAQEIYTTLRENLDRALRDFKREKLSKQNARLSLANAPYENPSLPMRKILLSVGGNNYRPPLERSKSAPKLMAIEEAIGEEDGEDAEQTNEPEMRACCAKDSLYPAMTLGRRKCRRGHSIRRTGKSSCDIKADCINGLHHLHQDSPPLSRALYKNGSNEQTEKTKEFEAIPEALESSSANPLASTEEDELKSSPTASDEDDLIVDKVLNHHNYDTGVSFCGELMSYFDMAMKPPKTSSSLTDLPEAVVLEEPTLATDPKNRPQALSLDNLLDSYSDCDEEDGAGDDADFEDEPDEMFYKQSPLLNLLQRRDSFKKPSKKCPSSHHHAKQDSTGSASSDDDTTLKYHRQHSLSLSEEHCSAFDSDEGSTSSGCETSSTVTNNMDDTSLKYNKNHQAQRSSLESNDNRNCGINSKDSDDVENKEMISTLKISSTTLNFKIPSQQMQHATVGSGRREASILQKLETARTGEPGDISDSEFSDESGYVEFQESNLITRNKNTVVV